MHLNSFRSDGLLFINQWHDCIKMFFNMQQITSVLEHYYLKIIYFDFIQFI